MEQIINISKQMVYWIFKKSCTKHNFSSFYHSNSTKSIFKLGLSQAKIIKFLVLIIWCTWLICFREWFALYNLIFWRGGMLLSSRAEGKENIQTLDEASSILALILLRWLWWPTHLSRHQLLMPSHYRHKVVTCEFWRGHIQYTAWNNANEHSPHLSRSQ